MAEKLYGKIIVRGSITVLTGLHIGKGTETLEIGGIDNVVIRDPISNLPLIPGSSLKGKLRALAEKSERKEVTKENDRHECADLTCSICNLFGSAKSTDQQSIKRPSRLIFRDAKLSNAEEIENKIQMFEVGYLTEVKSENTINRITAKANPRKMERVPPESKFGFEIIYNIETEREDDVKNDFSMLKKYIRLLEDDYLGGSGSRGYGKIKFSDISISTNLYTDDKKLSNKDEKAINKEIDEIFNPPIDKSLKK